MADNMKREISAVDNATKVMEGVQKSVDETTKTVQTSGEKLKEWGKRNEATFGKMAIAGGILSAGLIGIAKNALDVAGKFQKYDAVLTNTLQSHEEAKRVMDMIVEVASKTPFEIDGLTASYISLANRGIKPTAKEIVKLGDLASSQGKDFNQLAEAMLDAQTGEFERLKEFGIKASKSGDKVAFTFKGVTTQVKMTDDAVKNYIYSLGDLKGVAGGMATISATWEGAMSNMQDVITGVSRRIGDSLLPVLQPLILQLTALIGKIGDWVAENPELAKNIFLVVGAIAGLLTIVGTLGLAIPAIITGITAVGTAITFLTGPIGLIIVGITALAIFIYRNFDEIKAYFTVFGYRFMSRWQPLRDSVSSVFVAVRDFIKAVVQTQVNAIKAIFEIFTLLFTGRFAEARDKVKGIFKGAWDWIAKFFGDLANNALDWGKNLILMFITGIESMVGALVDKIKAVAGKIGSFLGFHSPTEEGPGSDADTWAPNFMKMFSQGLVDGTSLVKNAVSGIPTTVQTAITGGIPSGGGMQTSTSKSSGGGISINIGSLYGTDKATAIKFANDMVQSFKGQFSFESF